ncbi:MAG: hypothetical protein HND48_27055 [Chloroflexi bacterium]|nr:hypothetical protein [Chloroflexota bacterium]
MPIALRGQVLGAVLWELPINEFGDDKVQLAEELVGRLAVSLDNARLFEESQRAAERERVLNDIAAKITAQSDVEAILTTACARGRAGAANPQCQPASWRGGRAAAYTQQ